jgi:hypothetical protein
MTRVATCQCRSFRLVAAGEPEFVNICHCTECQRRSGVPLTCNAYFLKDNVRLEGEYKVYTRDVPTISIWEQSKYAWTETPSGCQHFPQMRPIPQPSTGSG